MSSLRKRTRLSIFRILPCETTDDVLEHLRTTIADDNIEIKPNIWGGAAPPGRVDTRAWKLFESAIHKSYPDALVIPGQLSGATDTRHFADLVDDIYRFIGVRIPISDASGAHGTNERLGIQSYAISVRINVETLREAAN